MRARRNTGLPQDRLDAEWERSTSWTAPTGRRVEVGTEVSIKGERGRFRFVEHVDTGDAEWLSVFGPVGQEHRCVRSFRPERVKVVHTKVKGRTS
jgi:hypothetical protein